MNEFAYSIGFNGFGELLQTILNVIFILLPFIFWVLTWLTKLEDRKKKFKRLAQFFTWILIVGIGVYGIIIVTLLQGLS